MQFHKSLIRSTSTMNKVGLLCGREFSFPPAFIARVNQLGAKDGVAGEFVKLGGTRMGEPPRTA